MAKASATAPELEVRIKYLNDLPSLKQTEAEAKAIKTRGKAQTEAAVSKIEAVEGEKRRQKQLTAEQALEQKLLAARKLQLQRWEMADERARQKMLAGHTTWSQKVVKGIEGIGKAVKGLATLYALNLGRQLLSGAIKSHADFSWQLARINTLIPQSSAQMKIYKEDIESIARSKFNVTLEDTTAAYYDAISASIPAGEATEFIKTSAKGATAGFATLSDAVRLETKLINAYNLQVKDTGRLLDLIFTAQKYGVTTFGDMAQSMGEVVDQASFLKVKIEDLVAGYIIMTKTVSTGEASTRLQALMTALMKPTDEFQARIGTTTQSMERIQEVGFVQFLQDIWKEVDKDADAIGKLFGRKEAIAGFFALIAEDGKKAAEAQRQVAESAGAMNEAYKIVEDETKLHLNRVKALWEDFTIGIGNVLSSPLDWYEKYLLMVEKGFPAPPPMAQPYGPPVWDKQLYSLPEQTVTPLAPAIPSIMRTNPELLRTMETEASRLLDRNDLRVSMVPVIKVADEEIVATEGNADVIIEDRIFGKLKEEKRIKLTIQDYMQFANQVAELGMAFMDLQAAQTQSELQSLEMLNDAEAQRWQNRSEMLRASGLETSALYRNELRQAQEAEKKREKSINKLKSKAFDEEKEARRVSVVMNTAEAIIRAWATLGPIFGPIGAGLAAATGAVQLAAIKEQKNPYRGSYREGGLIRGRDDMDRTAFYGRDGEFVLNKDATIRNRRTAEYMNDGGTVQPSGNITFVFNNPIGTDEYFRDIVFPQMRKMIRAGHSWQ